MEKFIVAGGCATRVSDTYPGGEEDKIAGEKSLPTVVLLHGYLENLDVWDDFVQLLKPHARVVAIDLPGHGISQVTGPVHTMDFLADVVHQALVELNAVNCYVIGHSMGGYVTLALAARHPEILKGLVLFSSTPNPDMPEKKLDREREIAIIESGKKELLARTLPGKGFASGNRKKFADEIEDVYEMMMLTEEDGIVALLRGMMARADQNAMLHGLQVPQMFIFGTHDEYIPLAVAERVAENHPQARVVWLPEAGHMGFVEQPQESLKAILEFINNK